MATVTPTHSCLTPAASNSSISSSSRACVKAADATSSDTFPAGLRVLVVDDDPICLLILDRMLRHCQYQVTTCGRATEALAMLRENRNSFDVILSDVVMPDMDGFKLLELVGLEMDLPVIMMSANGETSAVMKGIKHGACDYLLKPVRMEELKNIWQHVVRKKWRSSGQTTSHEVDKARQVVDEGELTSSANEGQDGTWRQSKKRKDMKEEEDEVDLENDDPSSTKKPRVVWSVELHQQFVNAVNQLGIDKAVPKRILEIMSVQGLTRENVASHLQKYRLYLKRISGVAHQSAGGLNPPFPLGPDANFGSVSAAGLAGLNELRALAGPSSSALVSSLQSGTLGRLNPTNLGMTNLDPSMLLRLAALQSTGHGALTRPPTLPSGGQNLMNVQGSFQVGSNEINQLQASQLGAFAGSLDKGPPGLSALQQQQLAAMTRLGEMGQLPGVGNNPLVKSNANALLMQTLQQQQAGGHLTSSKGSLPMTTNGGLGGHQGLSVDIDPWAASALSGSNSSSLRLLSVPSLANSATAVNPLGRATEADSRSVHIPNAGCVVTGTVSSPLIDELVGGARMRDVGASVLATNEGLRQSYASKFPLFSGLKQEQEAYPGQRTQGHWQGLDASQEQGHFPDRHIQSPTYSQSFPGGQNLMLGTGQAQSQTFTPRFSAVFAGNAMDNAQLKSFQLKPSHGDSLRAADGSSKIKEEGHLWLQEPLSDELLTIVLKQQQEGLGLTESELGGPDGYAMDNMYVK
ncbi:hypothetical protein L7F22_009880 [Adiantum nelumboides]|nr:hypothetical protein [Adiantum nelumboides]